MRRILGFDAGRAANGEGKTRSIDIGLSKVIHYVRRDRSGKRHTGLGLRLAVCAATAAAGILRQRRGRRSDLLEDVRQRRDLAGVGRACPGSRRRASLARRRLDRQDITRCGIIRTRRRRADPRSRYRKIADKALVMRADQQLCGRKLTGRAGLRAAIVQTLADQGLGVPSDAIDAYTHADADRLGARHGARDRAYPGRVIRHDSGLARGIHHRPPPDLRHGGGAGHIDQHHPVDRHGLSLAARCAHRHGDQFIRGVDSQIARTNTGRVADQGLGVMRRHLDIHRHADGRTFLGTTAIVKAADRGLQKALGHFLSVRQTPLILASRTRLAQKARAAYLHLRQDDVAHQIHALGRVQGGHIDRAIPGGSPRIQLARHDGLCLGRLHIDGKGAGQRQFFAFGGRAGPGAETG